jgi:hypothetical protein
MGLKWISSFYLRSGFLVTCCITISEFGDTVAGSVYEIARFSVPPGIFRLPPRDVPPSPSAVQSRCSQYIAYELPCTTIMVGLAHHRPFLDQVQRASQQLALDHCRAGNFNRGFEPAVSGVKVERGMVVKEHSFAWPESLRKKSVLFARRKRLPNKNITHRGLCGTGARSPRSSCDRRLEVNPQHEPCLVGA